jgi:hypothetical protein
MSNEITTSGLAAWIGTPDEDTERELRRPDGVSPAEWHQRQAAELRAIVRRSLLAGGVDPFR